MLNPFSRSCLKNGTQAPSGVGLRAWSIGLCRTYISLRTKSRQLEDERNWKSPARNPNMTAKMNYMLREGPASGGRRAHSLLGRGFWPPALGVKDLPFTTATTMTREPVKRPGRRKTQKTKRTRTRMRILTTTTPVMTPKSQPAQTPRSPRQHRRLLWRQPV